MSTLSAIQETQIFIRVRYTPRDHILKSLWKALEIMVLYSAESLFTNAIPRAMMILYSAESMLKSAIPRVIP
jgi:hypothetical protein